MQSTVPVALVTGASRGLGKGVAVELAARGYSVAINYAANSEAARQTAAECEKARMSDRQSFVTLKADISSAEDRARLVEQCIARLGRIDALVNNAGVAPSVRADITELSEESFDRVIGVNLKGAFFLTQAVVNRWLEKTTEPVLRGGFKVVFIGSISADTASVNRAEYCMAKAALAMTSQLWAVRTAEHNIQVYELRPGIMETDMTSGVRDKYDSLIKGGLVPQARWGTPDDVGRAVRSLLDGDWVFSTGSAIYIDGGFNIKRL